MGFFCSEPLPPGSQAVHSLLLEVSCIIHKFSKSCSKPKKKSWWGKVGGRLEKRKEKGYLNSEVLLRLGFSCFIIWFNLHNLWDEDDYTAILKMR